MLRSYFAVAVRNLVRHKAHSVINVLGLAVGLACCLLIALFVRHELSYDRHYADSDRIFRISRSAYPAEGNPFRPASNSGPAAALLVAELPEIEVAARLHTQRALLTRGDAAFYENGFRYVDPEFFELFDFEWLRGDPARALDEPLSVVLTESLAMKYFGRDDPIGRTLLLEHEFPLRVTGVIADLPDNTHLSGSAFAPLGLYADSDALRRNPPLESWDMFNTHTYVRAVAGTTVADIQSQLPAFVTRHVGDEQYGARNEMTATRLTDIHLTSGRTGELTEPGSMTTVAAFTAIAVCILLIACVNFMNLSTARSAQRAREVGVRKSMGADRPQLVAQFLGESILLAAIAMLLAVALVEAVLPAFGAFVGAELGFAYARDPAVLAALAGLTLLVGVVAGSYPALYLSAYEPAKVLKGEVTRGRAGAVFRNALVVLQFSVAIALLIATGVVLAQMRFAGEADMGFRTEQIVLLENSQPGGLGTRWQAFKRELTSHPGIVGVTSSVQGSALNPLTNNTSVRPQGSGQAEEFVATQVVDYDFFSTYGIEILAGRTFSPERASPGVVINALLARQYGWTNDEAVGRLLEGDFLGTAPIIGVVENALHESIRRPAQPYIYRLAPPEGSYSTGFGVIAVRITGERVADTLEHIDDAWREHALDQPISRRFLSDDVEALYRSEQQQGRMFGYFAGLAVFVACLGLFGLAAYNTERRTKEIGVRKVMGSSVFGIVLLLTGEFSKLVLAANLIAWPVAYFAMRSWLDGFAYRVDLGPTLFVAAAGLALVIAWLTVGGVAARAACANPGRALRYE